MRENGSTAKIGPNLLELCFVTLISLCSLQAKMLISSFMKPLWKMNLKLKLLLKSTGIVDNLECVAQGKVVPGITVEEL